MDHVDANDQIQSADQIARRTESPTTVEPGPKVRSRGAVFGLIAGLALGSLAGAGTCWLNEANDWLFWGALVGAAIGCIAGPAIGLFVNSRRADIERVDVATSIGIGFGLVPGALIFVLANARVHRLMSAYGLMGMFFFGPMIGFLIGGVLDRAAEASQHRTRREAITAFALAFALTLGLGWAMVALPKGPEVAELNQQVRSMIYQEWRNDPELRDAYIEKVDLRRVKDRVYSGTAEATVGGRREMFIVDATINDGWLNANWRPAE